MKNVFVAVLLIAAIGAGVYFLFLNKKRGVSTENNFQKELIVGKWKLDSFSVKEDSTALILALIGTIDSNLMNFTYDFQKDGNVLLLIKDSVQKDTAHYELINGRNLLWKEQGDSSAQTLTIATLNRNSLVLQTKDSTSIYFIKAR